MELSERQGYQLYNLVELYEREAVKATDQLYDLITSGVPLDLPINCGKAVLLKPPFFEKIAMPQPPQPGHAGPQAGGHRQGVAPDPAHTQLAQQLQGAGPGPAGLGAANP